MKRGEPISDTKTEKLLNTRDLESDGGLMAKNVIEKESDGASLESSSDSESEERKDMMLDFEQTWQGSRNTVVALKVSSIA